MKKVKSFEAFLLENGKGDKPEKKDKCPKCGKGKKCKCPEMHFDDKGKLTYSKTIKKESFSNKTDLPEERCIDCNGKGEITTSHEFKHCKTCNGSGKIKPKKT